MINPNVECEIREDFLLLRVTEGFVFDAAANARYWKELGEERDRTGLSSVLIIGKSVKRQMSTEDAFASATQAAAAAPGATVAYCFPGYQPDSLTEFFVNAARNRGVRIRFFAELSDALKFLGVNEVPADLLDELELAGR